MISKLPNTGTSIFAVMSKLAAEHNAINLSQGFPDFNCADELLELVSYYQKNGFNQYAPMPGVPGLRKEISVKTCNLYDRLYNPDTEITITAGATQALFTAITSLVQKGDEVIVFEPAYDSYIPVILLNGGLPIPISLTIDYRIDFELLEKAITPQTKLIILNSPHNPAGSVIYVDDLKKLEEIIGNREIYVISDEVYEHITFDGKKHVSLAQSEKLSKKSFIISSFGKTFHATGWKTGYCVSPEHLMNEFRKIHQFVVFAVNTPVQYAYADYLKDSSHYMTLNNFYQNKRDLFLKALDGSSFSYNPSEGTYFQLLDYSAISSLNDMDFAVSLIKKHGIAVIPLSPFYSSAQTNNLKKIRICFAKKDDILLKAASILKNIVKI